MTSRLVNSYLVQRLEKPLGRSNPFSFGGGYKNGGLSDEAMSLVGELWSFDYMGAAEYEWGAVPKALEKIRTYAVDGTLDGGVIDVNLRDIPLPWRTPESFTVPDETKSVYLIACAEHMDELKERVRRWALNDDVQSSTTDRTLRDSPRLGESLLGINEWSRRLIGGLELNNGFLFFRDEETWVNTGELFGLDEIGATHA